MRQRLETQASPDNLAPDGFASDSFARERLPPRESWPDLCFFHPDGTASPLPEDEPLNCVQALVDDWVSAGHGQRPCLQSPEIAWTYADLAEAIDRIAHVLVRRYGLVPGGRVLLRAPNTPMMVAAMLAVWKAGGIAVPTMPLLRASELAFVLGHAQIGIALCDHRLLDEMRAAAGQQPCLVHIVPMGGPGEHDLLQLMKTAPLPFPVHPTRANDLCLIAYTSGTTGTPKATMHVHRDILAVCDGFAAHILQTRTDDLFIGTAPLAFTFGMGAVVLFPLRAGAAAILIEQVSPPALLDAIRKYRPTICLTAPTAYRGMIPLHRPADTASLRLCISAGETLPAATWHAWHDATGHALIDGIGATEMLHIFIASPPGRIRPGSVGLPVPGYQAKLIDESGADLPRGATGRLAVRGPTGCRYMADDRQRRYVVRGWNVTGDTFRQDEDGYFWFVARSDDMIVSSGYNISGPEVEAALLLHPAVRECAVIGSPDSQRGTIVRAFIVLQPEVIASTNMVAVLQEHVKATIAPYKYPRAIEFLPALPRTQSGKLQRFKLK